MQQTDDKHTQQVVRYAFLFVLAVLGIVAYLICSHHPTGIEEDGRGHIVLATLAGEGDTIPTDSICIVAMPRGLTTHLIRTNGLSTRRVKYGHFENTESGQNMFLYLTGQTDTICFEYDGLLYVTDDWRK